MTAYFNLNNNEKPKELLEKKFNMILGNLGRLVLNDQKIPSPRNEPHRPPVFCSQAAAEGVLQKRYS